MNPDRRNFLGSAALAATGTAAAAGQQPERPPARQDQPAPIELPGRTPHTRFAVNVEMWWTRLPFIQRLEQAARLGFRAVEFWPWRGKDIPAIADACRRLNIEISQFTAWGFRPGLNDPRNHNRFVEEVEASCETARRLNCSMMCVVGGDDIQGETQPRMHDAIIDGLRRVVPVIDRHRMTLILEPMNIRVDHRGHCLYGSEPAVRIVRAVNSPRIKVLFDLYHNQITEGDLCGRIREGFPHLGYVQVADHPGRNEPGTGEVHFPRVLKQLHDLGYRGYVGLECRPRRGEDEAAQAAYRADLW
jgi:hydroxypyruvate isomerase